MISQRFAFFSIQLFPPAARPSSAAPQRPSCANRPHSTRTPSTRRGRRATGERALTRKHGHAESGLAPCALLPTTLCHTLPRRCAPRSSRFCSLLPWPTHAAGWNQVATIPRPADRGERAPPCAAVTDVCNHAAHGLRQYAADEALETAGFEVQGISFNAACMSQGCWELDVKYSLATKAMSVLYLPRTDGDDTLTDGGGYPASVESTFEPKLFPCGLMGAGRVDACCIKELMQSYRTPSAFEAHMASVDFSLCPSTPLSSQVLGDLDAVSKFQFIQGDFVGMPESEVGH